MINVIYVVLAAVIIYILYKFLNVAPKGYENISSDELKSLMKDKKVNLIDVRTKSEMSSGVIGKPHKIELDKNFKSKAGRLDKDKTYVLYCRSGRRSAIASKILASSGFRHVFNLSGGIGAFDQ